MENNQNKKISAFLSKQSLTEKHRDVITNFISDLGHRISSMSKTDVQPFKTRHFNDIMYPLNDKKFQTDASFLFLPPTVHQIGSFLYNCSLRDSNDNDFLVDIGLEIPGQCFLQKDHLDYVYYRKRALYLTFIANFLLKQSDIISELKFQYLNGDHLKPILLITPTKLGKFVRFRLLAFPASEKGFQTHKLGMDRCNIKHRFNGVELTSSPIYNSSILADVSLPKISRSLQDYFEDAENLQSAMILLKLWLEARGLKSQFSHVLTVYTCHLIKTRNLNYHLSALQIFKSIVEALECSNWNNKAVIFNHKEQDIDENSTSELYLSHFPVALIDAATGLNICYNVTADAYERLRYDARIAVKVMQDPEFCFDDLIRQVDFHTYFDQYVFISNDYFKTLPSNIAQDEAYIDSGFDIQNHLLTKAIRLINYSAGERLVFIQRSPTFDHSITWNLNDQPPVSISNNFSTASQSAMTLGMIINPERAFDKLIKGPLADRKEEADKFRGVWGEKSEIRRFQNGEICEAVFLAAETVEHKRRIVQEIISYILGRNLKITSKYISCHSSILDEILRIPCLKLKNSSIKAYGTGEDFNTLASEASLLLKRHLHNLSDLSFSIIDVLGIDSTLRHTEVFPPLPLSSTDASNSKCFSKLLATGDGKENKLSHIRSIRMIVKVESNVKLQPKAGIIPNQKYLFHSELSRALSKKHNIYSRSEPASLYVYFNGYVFHLSISMNKEFSTLRQLSSALSGPAKQNFEAKLEKDEYDCFALAPVTNCLATMAKENPGFAMTCRIFKRWLAIQMVGHYFEDVTCDLIVAYVFEQSRKSLPQPRSALQGLLRVLDFLRTADFPQTPLLINFNQMFTTEKMEELRSDFTRNRQNLPALYIVTPFDTKPSIYTRQAPNALILNHLKRQSNGTFAKLAKSSQSFPSFSVKESLKPVLCHFDIIIELKSDIISNKYESIDFPASVVVQKTLLDASKESETGQIIPVTDFCPNYQYLKSLKKDFGNLALFFYDHYAGRRIGVLLKPEVMQLKPFKPTSLEASISTGTAYSHTIDFVTLNLNALMEDFAIHGEGIVENVRMESDRLFKQYGK